MTFRISFLFLICAFSTAYAHSEKNITFQGEAFNLVNGDLLYREFHSGFKNKDGTYQWIKTEYRLPNGQAIADMESLFNKNLFVPEQRFRDYRNDYSETTIIENGDKQVEIFRIIKGKKESGIMPLTKDSVGGQGFHNFVVSNRKRILNETLVLRFLVFPKLSDFAFTINKDEATAFGQVRYLVRPANFILKRLVEPLRLSYDSETLHLLEFKGLSNLSDENGNRQNVLIKYKY